MDGLTNKLLPAWRVKKTQCRVLHQTERMKRFLAVEAIRLTGWFPSSLLVDQSHTRRKQSTASAIHYFPLKSRFICCSPTVWMTRAPHPVPVCGDVGDATAEGTHTPRPNACCGCENGVQGSAGCQGSWCSDGKIYDSSAPSHQPDCQHYHLSVDHGAPRASKSPLQLRRLTTHASKR